MPSLQVPPDGMARDPATRPFHHTLEDVYGAVAQYYDVQYLSLRTAVWDTAVNRPGQGLK